MPASHVMRCNAGCVPSPDIFQNIYAVSKRPKGVAMTEIFRPAPVAPAENNDGAIVLILSMCVFFLAAIGGLVYYFQDEIFGTDDVDKDNKATT